MIFADHETLDRMPDDDATLTDTRCTGTGYTAFAGTHAWRQLGPISAHLDAAQTLATSYDWCLACGNMREIVRRLPDQYLKSRDYWTRPPVDVLAQMEAIAGLRFDYDAAEARRCTAETEHGEHFWRRIGARHWVINAAKGRAVQYAVCDCGTIAHIVISWPEFGVLIADWDADPVPEHERRVFASQCDPDGHVWRELHVRTSDAYTYRRCGCGAIEETPADSAPILLADAGQR